MFCSPRGEYSPECCWLLAEGIVLPQQANTDLCNFVKIRIFTKIHIFVKTCLWDDHFLHKMSSVSCATTQSYKKLYLPVP